MKKITGYILVFLLVFLPRLAGISSFSTVDEPDYIKYGGNVYYSLGQREFGKTYQTYQPAVTTLYASAMAYHLVFPAYRGFGQGYFDETIAQTDYLEEKGVEPVRILVVARIIMILMVSLMLTLAFLLLEYLIGSVPAAILILLISFNPYFLGHSRLLTQEGLMSIAVVTSILAWIVYWVKKDKWVFIVISAITASLAILTKLSAIVVLPVIAIVFVFSWKLDHGHKKEHQTRNRFMALGIWLIVFLGFSYAFWPALWSHPAAMLSSLFETSFGFLGSKAGIPLEDLSLQGILADSNFIRYLRSTWWQVPQLTWAGCLLALFFFTIEFRKNDRTQNILFYTFLLLIIMMITMMSMGKKVGNHYVMISHVSLSILAGLGFIRGIEQVGKHFKGRSTNLSTALVLIVIIASQFVNGLSYFPYYFNYLNPLAVTLRGRSPTMDTGYGQGLELAAKYLSSKPDPEGLRVMSWWSPSFDYFFPGETEHIWILKNWRQEDIEQLESCDYLVVYYKTQISRKIPERLMSLLEFVEPETNISIRGEDMVRIYKVSDLPAEVFIPSEP